MIHCSLWQTFFLLSLVDTATLAKRYTCRGYPTPPCETATNEEACWSIPSCTVAEMNDDNPMMDGSSTSIECVHDGRDCGYIHGLNQKECEAIGCEWNEYWTQHRVILVVIVIVVCLVVCAIACVCPLCEGSYK